MVVRMNGTRAWMVFATLLLVSCGDTSARREASSVQNRAAEPVAEPRAEPVALPPAGSRAALADAGVVTVTANELFDGGDGGVVNDVLRAAQGAGYGEVEFAIKVNERDAAVSPPPPP